MKKDTRIHLVAELEKLERTPAIEEMIQEAKAGEYHDFKNQKYACGKVAVSGKLRAAGLIDLAKRVENGEFDEEMDDEDRAEMVKTIEELSKSASLRRRPQIMPRIRGKAIQIGARWGWEIIITFEPDRVIANLSSVDAQMVQVPESINMKSDKEFSEKQAALADLEEHANGVFRLLMKEFGDPNADMIDLKTLQRGREFKNGRIQP